MAQRVNSIDLLRGLIMIFMALDHCSAMVARTHFFEIWGVDFLDYPDKFWAFTRIISHLCAPGFFLLMGMSMKLFVLKKVKEGWLKDKIIYYFLKRGGLIIVLMVFIEFPAWGLSDAFSGVNQPLIIPGSGISGFVFPTTVLYGLGVSMAIGALLVFTSWWILIPVSILSFIGSGIFIGHSAPTETFGILEHLLIVPGSSGNVFTIYPVIPWLGVTTFGMFLAERWFSSELDRRHEIGVLGFVLLVFFIISRFIGWGNFQMNNFHSAVDFFTLIKYPPGFSFICFSVGIGLVLLYIFSYPRNFLGSSVLMLFGRTAMFFYLIHLYIYALIGFFFPIGTGHGMLYLIWIIGLFPVYFLCRYYLDFKSRKGIKSIWKMI